MDNFENEFDNLFEDANDIGSENSAPTDENNISSSDSEVLDLNSYFTVDDVDDSNNNKDKRKSRSKKSTRRRVLTIILAVFLSFVILCCGGGFAVMMYIFNNPEYDGTMEENLNELQLNYSTTIYAKNDEGEWVEYQRLHGEENRIWVDYNRELADAKAENYDGIPQYLANAFVAIEDKRFFDHEGVDWRRTIGAFINMITNRTTSGYGGSSITQQLVKNLTKDNDRSAKRKIKEIMRARFLEGKYTKETILECYMNTVAMGNGLYGVEVAAEYYFGKNVNELTLAECASIAGITNIPETYRPDKNPDKNKSRRDLVLDLMLTQELITQKEYDAAVKEPLNVVADRSVLKEVAINNYFVDNLIEDVVAALMEKYGWEKERAEANFYNNGYKIYATVDPEIQATMQSVYENEDYNIKGKKGEHLQGSMVIMDYSGNVLGMVGGMGEKTANRGLNRATMSPRQPGSTIKPLSAYAPAIERNLITYSTMVNDVSTYYNNNTWRPTNWYKSYKGKVTVEYALEISMNTIPVYLVDLLTKQTSYNFLRNSLGLSHLNTQDQNYSPLGMGGTNGGYTTLESAAAFAIFGNKGRYYTPITFTKICDQFDNVILTNESKSTVAVSEDTAVIMNKLLQNVVKGSEGTARQAKGCINMDFFAKTGTANHANDIWFVGGSPYYVGASWCGYDELQKISDSKRARKMWCAVMTKIHKGLEPKEFPESEFVECKLYCPETGLIAKSGCPVSKGDIGWYKTSGQKYCTAHDGEAIKANTQKEIKDYLEELKNKPVDTPETQLPDDNNPDSDTTPDNSQEDNSDNENNEVNSLPTD